MTVVTTPKGVVIEFRQQDWSVGFGCYCPGEEGFDGNAPAFCTIDLTAFLRAYDESGETPEELHKKIADTMLHECGHVLEHWLGLEFSEERVEALTAEYRDATATPFSLTFDEAANYTLETIKAACEGRGAVTPRLYRRLIEELSKLVAGEEPQS